MVDVAGNYRAICERINDAARKAGRTAACARVLGAAKSQDIDSVRKAISAGLGLIGENYVQEARQKRTEISEPVEWHMIGHLQRNKAKIAVELFDVIQSLDNVALARELSKEGVKRNKIVRVFVEVNVAGEASKSGVPETQVEDLLRAAAELANLKVEGLMAVPPFREDPEQVRPYFRRLRELREHLRELRLANVDLKELSMGMTHDYLVAVEEGATIVRIGTALFGPRPV